MLLFFTLFLSVSPYTMASLSREGSIQRATTIATHNIAKPGCQTQCGNVIVQYPFGIGIDKGCSIDESFDLTCDSSHNPPKLFTRAGQFEIYEISDSEMRVSNNLAWRCYDQSGLLTDNSTASTNLEGTPLTFSQKNMFTLIGCDDLGLIVRSNKSNTYSGCLGVCNTETEVPDGYCSGIGCCQTSIPLGLKYYITLVMSINNHTRVWSFNNCGYAFLGEEHRFKFRGRHDLCNSTAFMKKITATVPVVLDWVIGGNRSCAQATECKENSSCNDGNVTGYRCVCNEGYTGNPYLDPGCKDINECEDQNNFPCYGECVNTPGSHSCTCRPGYIGDAKTPDGCVLKDSDFPVTVFTSALVFGMMSILCGLTGIFFGIRRRKLMKLREKFFEQNGGLFLKQKIDTQGDGRTMTIFRTEQLRKATNNYSVEQIIGRGGYGVVYKGILWDKRVVAIKKSKLVDQTQAEQFINEVLILTQVIHRNVVKLLGCCLEEEVPVLVYEFISNNTLFHHIHHRSAGKSWLTWENRLRIATEAACALGYLHSAADMPIIHRDVKSTNILLDDNYTAKVSDFGASRLIPLDHDQVTTLVQGTLGYLDPEYFQTSQLTEKSDVYSFGVVLAELITGGKPLCADRTDEDKTLATYFLNSMKQNRLFEIVEPQVLREGNLEQLQIVADLVKRCLNLQGDDRPKMKEVAVELKGLRKRKTHPWVQRHAHEENTSLVYELEQSDLYSVHIFSYDTDVGEAF